MITKEIVVATLVFILCVKTLDSKPICLQGQYYDEVVGRCSPCTDICKNAAIQRTEMECARKCPDYKTAGAVKYFTEPKITTSVIVAIVLGALIITITVATFLVIWKKKKVKHFICKLMGRTEDVGEDGQNEETELKMVFLGKPAADDGNADNISNMTQDDTDREEMNSMVPPSDNNNIAQVCDNQPATYKPTPGVGKLSTGGLQ